MLTENGEIQPRVVFDENESKRFESRFVTVRINESPSIMLAGMHESVLGIWVAHGEGRHLQLSCRKAVCIYILTVIVKYTEIE